MHQSLSYSTRGTKGHVHLVVTYQVLDTVPERRMNVYKTGALSSHVCSASPSWRNLKFEENPFDNDVMRRCDAISSPLPATI